MEHFITCEVCGARNRVRAHAKQHAPNCGRCHTPLREKLFDRVMETVGTVVSEAEQILSEPIPTASTAQQPQRPASSATARQSPRPASSFGQMPSFLSVDLKLNQILEQLARVGWTNPTRPPQGFLLVPDSLGHPRLTRELQHVFDRLYAHVRIWAPGFNTPYSLPEITITRVDDGKTAGDFTIREQPTVTITEKYLDSPTVLRLILAHEACHHILNLSALNDPDRQVNERKTDLTMYICGFGEIARQGYESVQRRFLTTRILHLGYLQSAEHQQAYKWARQRRDELSRNIDVFCGEEQNLYKQLLNIVQGNQMALERWVDRTANRYPRLSTRELYQTMIEEYQRDNR